MRKVILSVCMALVLGAAFTPSPFQNTALAGPWDNTTPGPGNGAGNEQACDAIFHNFNSNMPFEVKFRLAQQFRCGLIIIGDK